LPDSRSVADMDTLISAPCSMVACRLRSRADLELEVIALRHQLAVLRRQRRTRPWLTSADRMFWVFLYRRWPRCLDALVLVKPATVVAWHRQGFRLFWHWRSQPGRPRVDREVRDLIRQMSTTNLCGGRVHRRIEGWLNSWEIPEALTPPDWLAERNGFELPVPVSDRLGQATSSAGLISPLHGQRSDAGQREQLVLLSTERELGRTPSTSPAPMRFVPRHQTTPRPSPSECVWPSCPARRNRSAS
jgi:hypothetical protein